MIRRRGAMFDVFCDHIKCDNSITVDVDGDFDLLLEAMCDDGWVSKKDRYDDWEHFCPEHAVPEAPEHVLRFLEKR